MSQRKPRPRTNITSTEGRDAIIHAVASLAAAIYLLENTPEAKKAAPSDKMFNMMLDDYRTALANARVALTHVPDRPVLAVWYGSMPESNGNHNWTAMLYRKDQGLLDGPCITIDRSEYPDRVRYEADRARFLIGEINKEPFVLDYDGDLRSEPHCTPPDVNDEDTTTPLYTFINAAANEDLKLDGVDASELYKQFYPKTYAKTTEGLFEQLVPPHDLYETRDKDAPDDIRDSNGEVVLGLCRRCGRGEVELEEPCTPRKKED